VTITLSSRQRQYLKSLGHHLSPVVHMGHHGVTDQLSSETERGLDAHELIKVKLGEHAPGERFALAEALAKGTGASVVQVIGRVALLYRGRKVDPTISLPGDGSVPPKAPKPAVKEEKAGAAKKGAPAKKTKKAPVVDPQDVWPEDV
jgi:RNA-binding protein